jgi:hypothetical protein
VVRGVSEPSVQGRRAARLVAVAAIALGVWELIYGFAVYGYGKWLGFDFEIYRAATTRLLSGGSWFLDRQLAGPYAIQNGDVLYPPTAAYLFAPFVPLPAVVFAARADRRSSAGRSGAGARRALAWAAIAVCLAWPTTQMRTISANPALWVAAAVALGLRYHWPAALVLLKPSLGPFALIGVRSRGWWLALGALALLSLPLLPALLEYPRVVLDGRGVVGGGILYSLPDLPIVAIPVVAWLARQRQP